LLRRWTSEKVSVPSSSTIIVSFGKRSASAIAPAAGLRPQRTSVCTNLSSLSGRIGRITPASINTFTLPSWYATRPGMLMPSVTSSGPPSISALRL
jgi:hypothetical protein